MPYGNLEALGDMIKELVVGGSGKLAKFFSNKIRNGGLLDATGKLLFPAAHKANALFTSQSIFFGSADALLLLRNRLRASPY